MDVTPRLDVAARRIAAWLVDWALILAWAAVLLGASLLLRTSRWDLGLLGWNLVSFAVLVAPVTLVLARREGRGATPGKRRTHVRVTDQDTGAPIGFGRALLRSSAKIAVPWTLGHALAFQLAAGDANAEVPLWVVPVAALTYGLVAWYLVALFVRRGRTPYDWLAGTVVTRD